MEEIPTDITHCSTINGVGSESMDGPVVPNEIQDYILDFIHDSKPALSTCALVCKSWVATSRYHLFREITLDQGNADDVVERLKDPNCTIRQYIQYLEANNRHRDGNQVCTPVTKAIQSVWKLLTPSALHLKDWDWSILDDETKATFAQSQHIERLTIERVYYENIHHLDDMLANFPSIRQLCMTNCRAFDDAPYTRDYLLWSPRLRSLELPYCDMNPPLGYFIKGRIVPTRLFRTTNLAPYEIPMIGAYFSMCGNVVQEVEVEFGSWSSNLEKFCNDANVQCLTGLRSLSLELRPTHSSNQIELFASILEKISSSTITKLFFGIPTHTRVGWHRVGKVLQGSKFSRLTELRVQLSISHDVDVPVEEWIRNDLPVLEERGILRLSRS